MFLAVPFFPNCYMYKCFVMKTCFASLTIIRPYIVNNWFNYYEHNGWSLNHEAWTWYTPSHLVSRKTCTNSI